MAAHRVTVLAGGVGAARFLQGLTAVMDPAAITVIGNVGDDVEVSGLHVSPDLDTVLYTLTDNIDTARGWGVRGDSTRALERARSLGADAWFQLGDLDLGLHMARTGWLAAGDPLSAVTERLATALGLAVRLLPASDDRLRTMIGIAGGEVDLQTYYVRRQHRDRVEHIRFDGAGAASPAPGVLSALHDTDAIIIAPSNPLISIGPILAVTGLREALEGRSAPCIAVTPIVAGAALRGPAADMLAALGHDVSAAGVAALYAGLVDAIVIDDQDAGQAAAISHEGVIPVVTDTVMRDQAAREHLARVTLDAAGLGAAA
jgi:LPPG:FO 2-phospho-L-lactate transferase